MLVRARALIAEAAPQNAGLVGHVRRAIDLRRGDGLDPQAFKDLVREAVALNRKADIRGAG